VKIGEVVRGLGLGVVVRTGQGSALKVGDQVYGRLGLQSPSENHHPSPERIFRMDRILSYSGKGTHQTIASTQEFNLPINSDSDTEYHKEPKYLITSAFWASAV
jgi:hypothetical protein